jgi:DNA-binding IclR family transcriptional regulator
LISPGIPVKNFPDKAAVPRNSLSALASAPPAAQSPFKMDKYVIPNLRNACRLLKTLAEGKTEAGVAALARELRIPATTTLRIVHTLEQEGFLRKDQRELHLGPALIFLGSRASGQTDLRQEAAPVLKSLATETDETAHVAIPCDLGTLIVAVCDSPQPLRAASRPGTMADLHCSSTGKTFLAFTHYERLSELLPKLSLSRHTPNTLTSARALKKSIEEIRSQGYSVDNEEFHPGVRCLAAPVRGASGKVVAAIGITAAATRFTPQKNQMVARSVLAAAADLSQRLGYTG